MPSSVLLQSGGAGAVLLFGLLMFLVAIALVVWTYKDAQRNSSHPASCGRSWSSSPRF